jgi:ferrous iron transport protein B
VRVALIGQPNCGKSTLFNAVAGYRSATGNFPGTTVHLAWSKLRLNGASVELVDVPGIYSLTALSPTECAAKEFLLETNLDLIINVVDASLLDRSLELTLELRDLGVPMVVCLNMMDEARRKGLTIASERLAEILEVPVVESVATRGEGVRELFACVKNKIHSAPSGASGNGNFAWHHEIEEVIDKMQCNLCPSDCPASVPTRFVAMKLLEGDTDILPKANPQVSQIATQLRENLARTHGGSPETPMLAARRERSRKVFEQVARIGKAQTDFRDRLDAFLTHPLWGYVALVGVLLGFFWAVFGVGSMVEQELLKGLTSVFARLSVNLPQGGLAYTAAKSVWDGFAGGASILLPYLVPFLVGLAFLEDVGYLPRVAYLMDGLLHRIGLHGTSTVPLILGYGCSVPACLATRTLPSPRDRFVATVLATLVPCAARSTVIFALVAFYLGPLWALGIFLFNGLIVFLSGVLLTRLWPEVSAGLVLEVPQYQWPSLRVISKKVWLRLREFIVVSWPLLVAGSLLLGIANYMGWDRAVNAALSPLTSLLGLPPVVGMTLIFGVLRKELSMLMLVQALGTTDVHTVLTTAQIVVFTVFITFYIPCVATLASMVKEIGRKLTLMAVAYTFVLATVLGVAARFLLSALRI